MGLSDGQVTYANNFFFFRKFYSYFSFYARVKNFKQFF